MHSLVGLWTRTKPYKHRYGMCNLKATSSSFQALTLTLQLQMRPFAWKYQTPKTCLNFIFLSLVFESSSLWATIIWLILKIWFPRLADSRSCFWTYFNDYLIGVSLYPLLGSSPLHCKLSMSLSMSAKCWGPISLFFYKLSCPLVMTQSMSSLPDINVIDTLWPIIPKLHQLHFLQ